jgi:maltooligosyltrehalose synthase
MKELEEQANEQHETLMAHLLENRYSAKIKLWLVHQMMNERKGNAEFFVKADYIPLATEGEAKDHVLSFARKYQNEWYVVAVPLHLAVLSQKQGKDILEIDWKDTSIVLPVDAPTNLHHLFSKTITNNQKQIEVKEIFKSLPLAVLKLK